MHPLFMLVDPCLIWFYRLSGYALVDFFIGTFVLAFAALVLGEITIAFAFVLVRKRIDEATGEVTRFHNLSMAALKEGDKPAYQAANKLANEAFGKSFFMQIALSAAFLWPIFFALVWMGYRFSDMEFKLLFTDSSIGYPAVFVALYAAAYLMFRRIKYKLPYFRRIGEILNSYNKGTDRIESSADIKTAEGQIKK